MSYFRLPWDILGQRLCQMTACKYYLLRGKRLISPMRKSKTGRETATMKLAYSKETVNTTGPTQNLSVFWLTRWGFFKVLQSCYQHLGQWDVRDLDPSVDGWCEWTRREVRSQNQTDTCCQFSSHYPKHAAQGFMSNTGAVQLLLFSCWLLVGWCSSLPEPIHNQFLSWLRGGCRNTLYSHCELPGQEVTEAELCRTQTIGERFHPWLCTPWVSSALDSVVKVSCKDMLYRLVARRLHTYCSMCGAAVVYMFSCTEKPFVRGCWCLTEKTCMTCFSQVCVSVCSVHAFHSPRLNKLEPSDRNGKNHFSATLYHKQTLKDDKRQTEKTSMLLPKCITKILL